MPAPTGSCATVTLTSMCQVERARVWADHDIGVPGAGFQGPSNHPSIIIDSSQLVDVDVAHPLCPSTDAALCLYAPSTPSAPYPAGPLLPLLSRAPNNAMLQLFTHSAQGANARQG